MSQREKIGHVDAVSHQVERWHQSAALLANLRLTDDIIEILQEWEKTRRQLCDQMSENNGLKTLVRDFERENGQFREDIQHLRHDLTEARAELSAAQVKNGDMKGRLDYLESMYSIIVKILRDENLESHLDEAERRKESMYSIIVKILRDENLESHLDEAERRKESMYSIIVKILRDENLESHLDEAERRKVVAFREDIGSLNEFAMDVGEPDRHRRGEGSTHSLLSSVDDLSYDPTHDNLEDHVEAPATRTRLRSGATWVRDPQPVKGKRKRRQRSKSAYIDKRLNDEVEERPRKRSKEDMDVVQDNLELPQKQERALSPMNRSFSEGKLFDEDRKGTPRYKFKTQVSRVALSNRPHNFTGATSYVPGSGVCGECSRQSRKNKIKFGQKAFTCTECKMVLCGDCRQRPPMPCIPKACTPKKDEKGYLADFVPKTAPMIPHVLVICIKEIERRGVGELGIYRVPGAELEVQRLLRELLWGKSTPNVHNVSDLHVLTSCVKKFMTRLLEPLLPHSEWHDMARAVEMESGSEQAVIDVIASLPQPNRETIAFLLIHLQRIAEQSDTNKMPTSNLALVFGPSVIGNSVENAKYDLQFKEQKKQIAMMTALLALEHGFWNSIVNVGSLLPATPQSKTVTIDVRNPPRFGTMGHQRLYPDISEEATPSRAPDFRNVRRTPATATRTGKFYKDPRR